MVTNFALAAICVETGLYKHMIFESSTLGEEIEEYAVQIQRAQALEYKIADNEDRPPGQYWVDIEPPKVSSSHFVFNQSHLSLQLILLTHAKPGAF